MNLPVVALDDVALLSNVILRATLAAGTLLTLVAILSHVLGGLADLASTWTTGLGALLGTVTNAVTLLFAESALDDNSLDWHGILGAVALDVTNFLAI